MRKCHSPTFVFLDINNTCLSFFFPSPISTVYGNWRFIRSCAFLGSPGEGTGNENYCTMRTGTYNVFVETCTCNSKDGCNSAPFSRPTFIHFLPSIAGFLGSLLMLWWFCHLLVLGAICDLFLQICVKGQLLLPKLIDEPSKESSCIIPSTRCALRCLVTKIWDSNEYIYFFINIISVHISCPYF